MIRPQERQMKESVESVAPNHRARYQWAIDELKLRGATSAIDAACGIGYGSVMLAREGFTVHAFDRDADAAYYQDKFFRNNGVLFTKADLADIEVPKADGAVSIETIEHLQDDVAWLKKLRASCKFLAATVPNEDVVHFDAAKHPFHFRHYTKQQFTDLLVSTGWEPLVWFTQYEKWHPKRCLMRPGDDGMTLGVICQ